MKIITQQDDGSYKEVEWPIAPDPGVFDPSNNNSGQTEKLSDVMESLEKENASLISLTDVFSGLVDSKSNKESEKKELADEFGKSVVETNKEYGKESSDEFGKSVVETNKEYERSPDSLDELMSSSWRVEEPKSQPEGDLRYSPDLDDLFGDPNLKIDTSFITDILSAIQQEKEVDFDNDVKAVSQQASQNVSNKPDISDLLTGLLSDIQLDNEKSTSADLDDLLKGLTENSKSVGPDPNTIPSDNGQSYDKSTLDDLLDALHAIPYGPTLPGQPGPQTPPIPLAFDLDALGNGGDMSCCDRLVPIFEVLIDSIMSLSAAVDRIADIMEPKKKKSKKEKEEERYQKENKSVLDMFLSGLQHSFKTEKEAQLKRPGKRAKSFGETIGAGAGKWSGIAENLGASPGGSISEIAGIFGGLAAGVGVFASAIGKGKDTIIEWNENLMRSNFQFAEFSGAMSKAQAAMEVRDMLYSRDRGDARADSADELAKSWSELKSTFAPIGDALANMWNSLLTILNKMLTALGKLIGLGDRPESRIGDAESAFVGAVEGAWLETYGVSPRFR